MEIVYVTSHWHRTAISFFTPISLVVFSIETIDGCAHRTV